MLHGVENLIWEIWEKIRRNFFFFFCEVFLHICDTQKNCIHEILNEIEFAVETVFIEPTCSVRLIYHKKSAETYIWIVQNANVCIFKSNINE